MYIILTAHAPYMYILVHVSKTKNARVPSICMSNQ